MDSTIIKGFRILEALARSENPRGITDLAVEMGLRKSNIHRTLKTLESIGYTRKDPATGRHVLTLKLWSLSSLAMARLDIKTESAAAMKDIATATRETVHLSMLDGPEVIYIDKIDSPEPVRSYTMMGGRAPAYAVATGKALLAFLSPEEFAALKLELEPFTPHTVKTKDELMAELASIRSTGVAFNNGEWRETVCGVAAPIRGASGRVEAAIGVSGPATRLKPKRLKELQHSVIGAAAEISRRLGYSGTPMTSMASLARS